MMSKSDELTKLLCSAVSDLTKGNITGLATASTVSASSSSSITVTSSLETKATYAATVRGSTTSSVCWADMVEDDDDLEKATVEVKRALTLSERIRTGSKGISALGEILIPKDLAALPRARAFFNEAAHFSGATLVDDPTVAILPDTIPYIDYWTMDETRLDKVLLNLNKTENNRALQALGTLEGLFVTMAKLPSVDDLKNPSVNLHLGVEYAACYITLIYQESVYGATQSQIRCLLRNRTRGRKVIEDAIDIAFPRDRNIGVRLVSAAETLIRFNIRTIVEAKVSKRAESIRKYLDAVSRYCLGSTGALAEAESRIITEIVQVPIAGIKGKTRSEERKKVDKPQFDTSNMPLNPDEHAALKSVNTTIDTLPDVLGNCLYQETSCDLSEIRRKLKLVLTMLYSGTDGVNRVIHGRRRMIRDQIMNTRVINHQPVEPKVTQTEWNTAQNIVLNTPGISDTLLKAVNIFIEAKNWTEVRSYHSTQFAVSILGLWVFPGVTKVTSESSLSTSGH